MHKKKICSPLSQEIFQNIQGNYDNLLFILNLQSVHTDRRHSGALFLIDAYVYNSAKFWPCIP
jgi:hypothetical protein